MSIKQLAAVYDYLSFEDLCPKCKHPTRVYVKEYVDGIVRITYRCSVPICKYKRRTKGSMF